MVKAIMHGCNGKMGQVISGLVKEDDVIEIVAGIDKFTGIENPYPVFTSLAECDVQADVVIDFSNAQQLMSSWMYVWRKLFRLFFAQQDFLRNSLQR